MLFNDQIKAPGRHTGYPTGNSLVGTAMSNIGKVAKSPPFNTGRKSLVCIFSSV